MENKNSGNHVRTTRGIYDLAKNVDELNDVRLIDGQIDEATNQAMINAWITEESAILMVEVQILFHGKRGRPSTELATVRNDVEGIFALIEKNIFGRVSNFEVKKIFQRAKVFGTEMSREEAFKRLDLGEIIVNY